MDHAANELTPSRPAFHRSQRNGGFRFRSLSVAFLAGAAGMALVTRIDDPAIAWANAGPPVLGVLVFVAYLWGWGSLLLSLPPLRLAEDDGDPSPVLAVGLCGALLAAFVLGVASLLRPVVLGVLGSAVIAAGFTLRPPWRLLATPVRATERWTGWEIALAVVAGVIYAAVATLCLLPDDSWDTVAYHLAIGKIYAREGRIAYLPWLFQSNFPVNGELLFLHGLLLDGDRLALPLNLVPYGAAAAATFRLARLHLARGPALLAMVVFMVTPEVAAWVTTCNVEITWAAFAGFALWCTLRWRDETAGRDAWLYLAGLFAGCAAGTKVVAILSGGALGAIILGSALDRRRGLASLTPVLKYGAVFVLAASPCYLKTYAHTGTPLWPETLGVFAVPDYSAELWERNLAFGRSLWAGLPMTPANLLSAAWQKRSDPSVALVAIFAVATLVRWGHFRRVAPLFLFVLVHYAFWCFATQQARFLIPALPAAIVGLMELTFGLSQTAVSRALCTGFWVVTLSASAAPWLAKGERIRRDALPLLSGRAARDESLRANPLFDVSRRVSAFTEPEARILLFQEVRGYFLDRDYVWGDPLNQDVLAYRRFPDPELLRQALRAHGIDYVLVGRQSFPFNVEKRFAPADWRAMEDFLAIARPVFATEHHVLFAVDPPPLAADARLTPVARAPLLEGGVLDGSVAVDASGYPLCRAP